MTSPLLVDVKMESVRKFSRLTANLDGRPVIDVNDGKNQPEVFKGVKYALVWKPDSRLFERLPDLEVLFSMGAGVDHIFQADMVPDVPIVRFVDHTLTTRMSEWVLLQCLMHLRQARAYDRLQRAQEWRELPQPQASEITIGIMGMGVLGSDAAKKLSATGFNVIGWSRSGRSGENIRMFDESGLEEFLAQTDFLVGLLPLTAQTTGFFNRSIFEQLKRGSEIASPVFINAGRGKSQVETDIAECLRDGTLGGVSLDVFEEEPLPAHSPLWSFDNAILTPHAAAVSDVEALGRHVATQIRRHESAKPLEYLVDRQRGY